MANGMTNGMIKSKQRILTTHVGSLPRSRAVTDGVFAKELHQPYNEGELRKTISEAVDTVVHLDPASVGLLAVTNPFAVTTGVDPETREEISQIAPEAFKALTFRAVRDEDYEEIAERLPWVQQAGSTARWTGSWMTQFATADPLGSFALSAVNRLELEETLDCVRQVGREVYVQDPRFLDVDLEIGICVAASAYPGQVRERVVRALTRGPDAFFHPDNFSFGTPLRRAALEAAVQAVAGVRAVEAISIRVRGVTDWRALSDLLFEVGDDQILRHQNDPLFPGRGTLRVATGEGLRA